MQAKASEGVKKRKIPLHNDYVWMKLRNSFAYNEFPIGVDNGSIWLDGEVTSVGDNDKVPFFDCTFGRLGQRYYKVVTVNGVEGLETIKMWNRFFNENINKEPPSAS